MSSNDSIRRQLVEVCLKSKENAYCPYSKFRVGAALLTPDNKIFTGCNMENASYGLTICAERVAYGKAISEGYRTFTDLAVCSDMEGECCGPCGACRQVIAEFGLNYNVILVETVDKYRVLTVRDLLPYAFDNTQLENGQNNRNKSTKQAINQNNEAN